MKLTPVDGDPFSEKKGAYKLRAVKGNPFEEVKTDDPGALGAALIGFGRMSDRLLQGGKQAALTLGKVIPGAVGQSSADELARMREVEQFRDEGYKPLQEQRPVATMLGESAPLVALPMGGSIKAAAAIGAMPGLLEYGSPEDKLKRGAAGAVGSGVGHGVGKAIGAVVSPGMKAASPEVDRLAEVAAREGIPLDASQRTGNQVLQNMKAALSRIPWTASGQQARAAKQGEAFNEAVLRHAGTNAKAATPDVMADAFTAITQKMGDAANSVALTLDDAAVAKIAEVEKNFLRRLPTDQKAVIRSYLEDLTEAIGKEGAIPGDVYNKTRSELGRLAFSTENITVREGAKGLQKALDDAFDRQAPEEAVRAMKEARKEYSRYMTIESAVKKGRSQDGNISPKQLYAQAQQDIPGFARGGGGEFNDVVRAGRQFLPDAVPNSGTPERLMYQNLIAGGAMSGLGATGGLLTTGDASAGALAGLGGFGASKALQGMLNSPQLTKYLMTQVLTEEQKRLLAQMGGKLGLLGAAANY